MQPPPIRPWSLLLPLLCLSGCLRNTETTAHFDLIMLEAVPLDAGIAVPAETERFGEELHVLRPVEGVELLLGVFSTTLTDPKRRRSPKARRKSIEQRIWEAHPVTGGEDARNDGLEDHRGYYFEGYIETTAFPPLLEQGSVVGRKVYLVPRPLPHDRPQVDPLFQ
ncbi:MAG: hypothetical protein D6812_10615 [Deltaproteobacteria bacterium]|nr:MAG: hypothetical protein D6812_10615 [Deltaproteobacteria bacterium]